MEPIREPDKENTDPEYWEGVLRSHGLGMGAGRPSRRLVSHVGTARNVEGVAQEMHGAHPDYVPDPYHPEGGDTSKRRAAPKAPR